MKKLLLATTATIALSVAAFADNPNWDQSKANQIDRNRNSDAGIGNGGERYNPTDGWRETRDGEDGGWDRDPGNSGDHNQACDTSC